MTPKDSACPSETLRFVLRTTGADKASTEGKAPGHVFALCLSLVFHC